MTLPGRRGRRRSRGGAPRAAAVARVGVEGRAAAERERGGPLDRRPASTKRAGVDAVGGEADARRARATLAVGKPSSRPRRSPCSTVPRTSCGPAEEPRPRSATSPVGEQLADARRRVRRRRSASPVDRRRARGRATSKPSSAPIRSSSGTLPRALVAEVEVGADDDEPGAAARSTSTSRTNSSAGSWLRASSNVRTHARRRRSRSRRAARASARASVSSFGADSGRTTSAGWRSKVTQRRRRGRGRRRARGRAAARPGGRGGRRRTRRS